MKKTSKVSTRQPVRRYMLVFGLAAVLLSVNSYLFLTGTSDYLLSSIGRHGLENSVRAGLLICLSMFLLLPGILGLRVKKGSVTTWLVGWNILALAAFMGLCPVKDWAKDKGGLVANIVFGDSSKAGLKSAANETESDSLAQASQNQSESVRPIVPRKWHLTSEDQARIAELEEYRKIKFYDPRGGFEKFSKVEYADAWVYMADTLTDPGEIVPALRMAGALHSNNPKNNVASYSDKFIEVVDRHLQSKDPRVIDAALGAALGLVMKPNAHQETADLIMGLAESHPSPEVRVKAFDSLWTYPVRSERFLKLVPVFLDQKNDADTLWVGIRVVSVQYDVNSPFPKELHDTVVGRTWELMDHNDPRISTLAVTAQDNLFKGANGEELDRVGKRLIEKLKDKKPAVRTRAAQTLAKLDYEPALPALVPLLSDHTENCYGEGGLKRYTSRQHRIDDSALAALDDLTQDLHHLHFAYSIREKVKYDPALQSEVTKEASRAKRWYEENKDSLPQAR